MAHHGLPGHQTGGNRYQMLDVWRGAVCLFVVLEHIAVVLWTGVDEGSGWEGWLRHAVVRALTSNIGTPLFFVMSGYCIAASLESTRRKGTSAGAFFLKRLWRIYPTYWAALFGFIAVVVGLDVLGMPEVHRNGLALELGSPRELNLAQWLGNLTLTETWRPLLAGGGSMVYTRVAWSLCYQEQFYVVCVLAFWLAPKRLERTLAIATAAILTYRLLAWDSGGLFRIQGTFPYYWHEFAIGLVVYWRLSGAGSKAPALTKRGVELGLVGLAVIAYQTAFLSTLAAALYGLLLIAMYRWDHRVGALAWVEPIRACGRRSYSIYLTHLPVTIVGNYVLFGLGLTDFWVRVLVLVPMVTAASVGVGWAFHHAVERRFLGQPPLPKHSVKPEKSPLAAIPA